MGTNYTEDNYLLNGTDSHFIFIQGNKDELYYRSHSTSLNQQIKIDSNKLTTCVAKLNNLTDIPSKIEEYYLFAKNNPSDAKKQSVFQKLDTLLFSIHPFFRFTPNNCNYSIADKLLIDELLVLEETCYFTNDFIVFIKDKNLFDSADNITLSLSQLSTYIDEYKKEKTDFFVKIILQPILLRISITSDNGENYTDKPLYKYIESRIISFDRKRLTSVLRETSKNTYSIINTQKKYDIEQSSLFRITETFSHFSNLCDEYILSKNDVSLDYLYLQILSRSDMYFMRNALDKCKSIPIRKYILDFIKNQQIHMTNPDGGITLHTNSELFENICTDIPFYQSQINSLNSMTSVTLFDSFEQYLYLLLDNLVPNGYLLKSCQACQEYFITKSKKIKYCTKHRNNNNIYQVNYVASDKDEYTKIYNSKKSTMKKRKARNLISETDYETWKSEAHKILNQYKKRSTGSKPSEEFDRELDNITKALKLKSIRAYKK